MIMRSSKECTSGPKRFEEEKKRVGRLDGKRIQGLRGGLAGITHELPCPRVHRSLLTKTIKLNDAYSDASPGQKLFFFFGRFAQLLRCYYDDQSKGFSAPQAPK